VEKVAETIVKAMEGERRELVLSLEGKALAWIQGALPGIVDWAMARIASDLRD
jgi:hypothetical protein